MENTKASEVIDSFESSFSDKRVIPESLERVWLAKAIGRYSAELTPLAFDEVAQEFDSKLDRYVVDTLAEFMKEMYQERQLSLINKRISIVSKDLSWDGSNGAKTAAKAELEAIQAKIRKMVDNQKTTAYT